MSAVFLRTVVVYLILLVSLRLMGKRQIGELLPSELVTALLLSDVAVQPVLDPSVSLLRAVIPVGVIILLEIVFSFLTVKFRPLEKLFSGRPSVIINKGKLDVKEMGRLRMTFEELMSELRLKEISDINQVYYAIMEPGGKLSVIRRAEHTGVCCSDLSIPTEENGISRAVIEDGEVNERNLILSGKNMGWLKKRLEEMNCDIGDIAFFTVDDKGSTYVVRNK